MADLLPYLPLALKLGLTALIVVTASVVTEKAGALAGALLVTLPVTTWPAFVFLSMDHDTHFIAASALTGVAMNMVNGLLFVVYAALARRRGLIVSLGLGLLAWAGFAFVWRDLPWTIGAAVIGNLILLPVFLWITRRYRQVVMPKLARRWYELPLRTAMVCALMALVLAVGAWGGPVLTGMAAMFPVSTTSTMLILHSRVGGEASAAVVANGLWGVSGVGWSVLVLHLAVVPFGAPVALGLSLATAVGWNLMVFLLRRRGLFA